MEQKYDDWNERLTFEDITVCPSTLFLLTEDVPIPKAQ